ncbi:MAG: 3-dehydroquinate synthase [Cytophagaceae bacterium]|nr:3-dehydroquinate synthase [Cytophagaceae bacterium]
MPSQIIYSENPQEDLLKFLKDKSDFGVIIVDENTKKHCLPFFEIFLTNSRKFYEPIVIKSGEENKTLDTCQYIWSEMTKHNLDRNSFVINLGGGVIGDMGGFCAATYKRGVSFIQIPTTLLSQVDASIGGKLGIDFDHYKNHIGVFKEPEAVIICFDFLKTLDPRELRSGFAEVIKHALIADVTAWNKIKGQSLSEQKWNEVIPHSVKIKSNITTEDPTEKGLRKVLNFGHTLGHAVESYFLEKGNRILHGEAIAIGMIMEAFLSAEKEYISKDELKEIETYILSIYGHVAIPTSAFEEILTHTLQDKKNEQGLVLFSLLKKIGEANYNIPINEILMKKSLTYYNSLTK